MCRWRGVWRDAHTTNHQGNADQIHSEASAQPWAEPARKRREITSQVWQWTQGHIWVTLQIENRMQVPQKIKNRNSIQSSNFTSRYFIEGNENESTKISVSPCLLEHHLPQLRYGRLDKGVTHMDTIQPSKRRPCHFWPRGWILRASHWVK